MHPAPTTPLGQAFAAIVALLIAAIAEHAVQHPVLAPLMRATIKQLEDVVQRFEAMAQAWEAGRPIPESRRTRPRKPGTPEHRRAQHRAYQPLPRPIPHAPHAAARDPPMPAFRARTRPTPPASPPRGAARMYAAPTP